MKKHIQNLKNTRRYILDVVKDLTIDQFNDVPSGFKNNIVWNLGHLIASQQGLCYIRSGLPPFIDENFLIPYRPGTQPDKYVDASEIDRIKEQLFSSLEQFERDYERNIFISYNAFTTRYGVELTGIHDALEFLPYHEGMHSGTILALTRLV